MESAFPGVAKTKLPPVVVLGAGYVGGAVVREALRLGHKVTALTRNPVKAQALANLGADVVVADVARGSWHQAVSATGALVLFCVSSGGGGAEAYQKSYYEGASSVASWLDLNGPASALVYTGSTSVYAQGGGVRVTEDDAAEPDSETGRVLRRTELVVLGARGAERTTVLRLAGIYGPERHHLLDQLREGVRELPGRGEHHLNLIHRDDIVSAVFASWTQQAPATHEIYNLADDAPSPKEQMVSWLCEKLGRNFPVFTGQVTGGRRSLVPDRIIDSGKIRRELGWRPQFPSFREGYSSLLGA